MASVVGICNNALIKIGHDTITALTENSKAARLCNQIYEDIRDAVFRAHPWNCLIDRVELAALTTTPAFEYTYEYQLPADCLRVLSVQEDDIEFKIENRTLLTDEAEISIRYIKQETDPNAYDALLREAVAARLAAELAIPLSDSTTLAATMWEAYKQKLVEARGMDGQEGTPEDITAELWLEARV